MTAFGDELNYCIIVLFWLALKFLFIYIYNPVFVFKDPFRITCRVKKKGREEERKEETKEKKEKRWYTKNNALCLRLKRKEKSDKKKIEQNRS